MTDRQGVVFADEREVTVRKIALADARAARLLPQTGAVFGEDVRASRHHRRGRSGPDRAGGARRGLGIGLDSDGIVAYFFLWRVREAVPVLGIGIADAWQDCGLGQRLMSILIEDAKALDRDGISLTTMLDNDRAYHIYLKMGFIDQGTVTHGSGITEHSLFLPLKPGAAPP